MRMTKFNECPYCGNDVENDMSGHDPLGEGESVENECSKCGKVFMAEATYSVDYNTWEVPCLNDGEHDWQPINGCPKEFFENKERCSYCNKERIKPKEVPNK